MPIDWIDLDKYTRRDRNAHISINKAGQGYVSRKVIKSLELDDGDVLGFCRARLNGDGDDEPQLYMTVMEESGELGGAAVRMDKEGSCTVALTSLMYALGADHKETKLALDVELEPVFHDEMFFYPVELKERE